MLTGGKKSFGKTFTVENHALGGNKGFMADKDKSLTGGHTFDQDERDGGTQLS